MDDRTLILSARATEPMQKDAEANSAKTKRRWPAGHGEDDHPKAAYDPSPLSYPHIVYEYWYSTMQSSSTRTGPPTHPYIRTHTHIKTHGDRRSCQIIASNRPKPSG